MPNLVNENRYDVPMNGPYHGASQWIHVDFQLYDDGTIKAPLRYTNDVFGSGFCGSVRLQMHDRRDNSLLASFDSPAYCISSKGFDGHQNSAEIGWDLRVSPEIAQTYKDYPSLYITASGYHSNGFGIGLVGEILNALGDAVSSGNGNGD